MNEEETFQFHIYINIYVWKKKYIYTLKKKIKHKFPQSIKKIHPFKNFTR